MTLTQRRLADAALRAVLAALLASADAVALAGADLRRLCDGLAVDADRTIRDGTFGTPLRACFEAATAAGATFAGMGRVLDVSLATVAQDLPVQRIAQTAARFALVELCRIGAGTPFTNRQDVETALARLNAGFEPVERFAADRRNATVYQALVTLHAAAVRDLSRRARPLPRMVGYVLPAGMPLLTLANRLYGDAGRAAELRGENAGAIHPLFMPASGRALSV